MQQQPQSPPPPIQGNPQHGYPQGPQPCNYPPPPASYYHPPPPPPPPNNNYGYPSPCYFLPPPNFYSGFPFPPGSTFNAGGNTNGSGIQKNGDVNVGNKKEKSGGVDIGTIGGNHGNRGGQQISGDVNAGNIGC